LIQLWEGLIWYFGTTHCLSNTVFVPLILVTLYLQPFVQTWMGYLTTKQRTLYIMSFVYIVLLIFALYRAFTENFSVVVGEHGHLVWNTDRGSFIGSFGVLYLLGMFLGLLYDAPTTLPLIVYGLISFTVAMKYMPTKEFSSFWCYIAVGYSVVAYFS